MNKFIRKMAWFAATLMLLFVGLYILLDIRSKQLLHDYTAGDKPKIIFMGDSHIQVSIVDTMVSSGVNIAQNSESYYYTYFKILQLLKPPVKVHRIYLGFSYHNLSSYFDAYINGKHSLAVAGRYHFILPPGQQCALMWRHRSELADYASSSFAKGCANVFIPNSRPTFAGYYHWNQEPMPLSYAGMSERIKSQYYYSKGVVRSISTYNLEYLYRIISLCKERNVELVLLNSPLHEAYFKDVPGIFVRKYQEVLRTTGVRVIEAPSFLPDSCFSPDGDHLSGPGAFVYTDYVLHQSYNY